MPQLDRRRFLSSAAGSTALLVGAAGVARAEKERLEVSRLGKTPHTRSACNLEMWWRKLPFPQRIKNAASFGQEYVEAVVTSSKITTKAAEGLSAEIAAYSKKAYEDSVAAAKELTTCKSVSEFVEKQTEFGKISIEGFVAEATKLNEMYAAAAKEAFAPLNARFTAAAGIVKDYRV